MPPPRPGILDENLFLSRLYLSRGDDEGRSESGSSGLGKVVLLTVL